MRTLTLMASIFLPLLFIVIVFALIIRLPFMEYMQASLIVSGVMVGIALFVVIYFKVRKWM
jgi:Mg2+ and Co2+ transporter CorA